MELPLHPGIVHLPLGLAFLLPLLGLGLAFAIARAWLPRRAWAVQVFVAALTAATAVFSQRTGEDEERRVAAQLDRQAIHQHEEAAERFVAVAVGYAVLAAALLFLQLEVAFRAASFAAGALAFLVLGTGTWAGRRGGELIWQHGAANTKAAAEPTAP